MIKLKYDVYSQTICIDNIPEGAKFISLSRSDTYDLLNQIGIYQLEQFIEHKREEAIKAAEIAKDINFNINKITTKVAAEVKNNDADELERIFNWIFRST